MDSHINDDLKKALALADLLLADQGLPTTHNYRLSIQDVRRIACLDKVPQSLPHLPRWRDPDARLTGDELDAQSDEQLLIRRTALLSYREQLYGKDA
jgi:hypothetical protein